MILPLTVRRQSLLAGLLALLLFCAGVYGQAPIGFDSRFVLFAQEMLRHGPTVFPTTYGQPYADYTSLSTLFIWLLSLPFGAVNSLTAWLPSAIAGALIVTLMYRLLAPFSLRWAWSSIALLLLTITFVSEVRAVSQDLMLAAVAFSVFYLGYAHDNRGAGRRWPLVFGLLLLGFGIRGPIGLVVPTGILCSYYLLTGQWRRLLLFGGLASLLLVASVGLLLWMAKASGGQAFLDDVIRMQFMGRMDGSEGASSALYYFTSSLGNYALAYPLAILALLGAGLGRAQLRGPALYLVGYCAAAALLVMLGLSIPLAKKARYLLPMLPMVAIIAAYPFQVTQGRLFAWLRGLTQGLWLLTPGLMMIAVLVAQGRFPEQIGATTVLLVVLAALQLWALSRLLQSRWRAEVTAGCAVMALWLVYVSVFEPVERRLYDTRSFTQAVLEQVTQQPAPLVLHHLGRDAKAIKFMVNLDHDMQPLFSETPAQLQALQGPAWLMMDRHDFQALQQARLQTLQPQLSGRFDNNDYVLVYLGH
ncbi:MULTISPECIES: ArnT family glycosyltransferase [unclassified Pseudomonas]|uniref:ArnT family glycosyltransferase n=1 Tax=unclassified Pseudomonas TaxID=196821 RepID=UPI000A08AC97|nr:MULTISPECIES: glycosyltransferase family 39 protein [unclassified Pseudomonas]RAS28630.1 4-amino-4-deoxy-L-arabinose transferase-like glycosyltransferase [Pseudomonas sp. URMO17WK12:I7]SMF19517.1 4-amino-4-deoxy-L-arabinose transferase [Pseudomonas sp. URMO17WK12:I5]